MIPLVLEIDMNSLLLWDVESSVKFLKHMTGKRVNTLALNS